MITVQNKYRHKNAVDLAQRAHAAPEETFNGFTEFAIMPHPNQDAYRMITDFYLAEVNHEHFGFFCEITEEGDLWCPVDYCEDCYELEDDESLRHCGTCEKKTCQFPYCHARDCCFNDFGGWDDCVVVGFGIKEKRNAR